MTKKLLITLSILTLFANCTKASDNNSATHDEGVVINGIRWATRNVDMPGTFAETPDSLGMFFQWNRKRAWNAVDEEVENWNRRITRRYRWARRNDPCPRGWRVPTENELEYLVEAGSEWTTQNGVYGRLFGVAPSQIFLSAAGMRSGNYGTLRSVGVSGLYWSSTRVLKQFSVGLWFRNENVSVGWDGCRNGFSVRCVAK